MNMVDEADILERIPALLEEITGLRARDHRVRPHHGADLMLRLGAHRVIVEAKSHSRAAVVAQAAQHARDAAKRAGPNVIPLIAVPYMGDVGRSICNDAGVGFVDLSGNAMIQAPGLRIDVTGKPNRFIQRGRPSSVFAPKSSRVARLLLLDPKRWWRQTELSNEGKLGPGFVSKICARLELDHLIERDSNGALRPRDPTILLDGWKNEYDFRRHDVREGHVSARTGEDLAKRVLEATHEHGFTTALTGLPAAWLLAPFAGFRLVAVYVNKLPTQRLLDRLKWHEEKRGANLWLVRPNDEGVFHGAKTVKGMSCVSPVQAFLDLQAMPERSEEAAEHLRKERMQWR